MKPRRGDLPIRPIRSASSEKLARAWFKPQEIRTTADSVIMQERNMTHRGTHGLAQVQADKRQRIAMSTVELALNGIALAMYVSFVASVTAEMLVSRQKRQFFLPAIKPQQKRDQ